MPRLVKIDDEFENPAVNLSIDTLRIGKQALIFVNTKKSAEKTAEEIAKIQAYKILHTMAVEFQDSAIAASFITSHSDFLLTLNIKHFKQIPNLRLYNS